MEKKDLIIRIESLSEDNFSRFSEIAEKILGILDNEPTVNMNTIDTSEKHLPISEKLKKARKEKGLTQIQLANNLMLSKGQIGNIESNLRYPSKEVAKKLSKYFNTDIEYWL